MALFIIEVQFSNQVVYLGIFLVGNVDNLVTTNGCAGISYLNTCKRVMPLLNVELSALEITMNAGEDECLTTEIL